jgi:hypothetical protein
MQSEELLREDEADEGRMKKGNAPEATKASNFVLAFSARTCCSLLGV